MISIKVGIVGCGGIANAHLDDLNKIDDIEVCALATGNLERLEATGQKAPGARLYQDWKEMLEQETLDILLVCVTPGRHEGIEQAAAAKGIHMYVEKPLELDGQRAEEISRAIEQAGVLCSVGYQERYSPAMEEVRSLVQQGGLGSIGHICGWWIGSMPGAAWWQSKAASGGQIVEQCTHIFDLLRNLFGEVAEISCKELPMNQQLGVSDVEQGSCAQLRFKSGQMATVMTGCYLEKDVPSQIGFTLYGTGGRVEYKWGNEVVITTKAGVRTVATGPSRSLSLESFVEAVRSGSPLPIRSPYADALQTFKLTLAANQSMESGMPVCLA